MKPNISTVINTTLATLLLASILLVSVIPSSSVGEYDPWCDLDDDGDIDIFDIVQMAGRYGTTGTSINKTDVLLGLVQGLDSLNASLMTLWERVKTLHGLRLAGCWKFEERDMHTAYDSSGYGNDGNMSEIFFYTDGAYAWSGSALRFPGYVNVTVPDHVSLDCTAVTLEACVFTQTASERAIVSKWGDNGFSYALELEPDGITPRFTFYTDTAHYIISNITVPHNSWAHIAGTYDGETAKIYVNGTLAGSSRIFGSIQMTTAPVCIGSRSCADINDRKIFLGILDEVRIYNYALTSEEILADMNG